MSHNLATIAFIESIVQDQLIYKLNFTKQSELLKTDQPRLDTVMAKMQQSPLVAKPGQQTHRRQC